MPIETPMDQVLHRPLPMLETKITKIKLLIMILMVLTIILLNRQTQAPAQQQQLRTDLEAMEQLHKQRIEIGTCQRLRQPNQPPRTVIRMQTGQSVTT